MPTTARRSCEPPGTTDDKPGASARSRADRRHPRPRRHADAAADGRRTAILDRAHRQRSRWMASCAKPPRISPPATPPRTTGCAPSTIGWWTTPTAIPTHPAAGAAISGHAFTRQTRRQVRGHQWSDGRSRPRRRFSRPATCTASASPIPSVSLPGRERRCLQGSALPRGGFPRRRRMVPARSRGRAQGRAGTENSRSTARKDARCETVCSARGK